MVKVSTGKIKKSNLRVGKKPKISKWLIFDGIVLIIIVGVLAVRFTRASVDSTFTRTPQQMTGGTLARSVADGNYRHIVADDVHAEVSATVSEAEVADSGQICAQFRVNSPDTFIDIQLNGQFANKFVTTPSQATVCVATTNKTAGSIYAGTSGNANVISIYGTK